MVSWKYQCRRCPSEGPYTARKTLCMKTRSRKIGPYRKVDIPCGTVRKQRDDIGKPRAEYDNSSRRSGYHPRGRYHKVETWKRQNWWTQGEGWAVNIFRHFSYRVHQKENEEPFNATYLKLKTQRERLDLFQERYVEIMEREPSNSRLLQEALKLVFYLAYSSQRALAVDKKQGRITKKAVQKYGLLGRASLGHDTVYKNERDVQDMEETLTEEMPVFDIATHPTVEIKINEFLKENKLPPLRNIQIPNFENSTKTFDAMQIHFLASYEEIRRNLERKIAQANEKGDEEAVVHMIHVAKRDFYAVLQPYLKFVRIFEDNVTLKACIPLLMVLENFFVEDFDPATSLQEGINADRFRKEFFPGILKNVERIVGVINERIERSGKLGKKRDTRRTALEESYERQLNNSILGKTKKDQKEREKLLKAYMTRVDTEEIQKVGLIRFEDRYIEENETDAGLLKSCKYLLKLYYEIFLNSFEMVTDLQLPPQKDSIGDRWLTAYPEDDLDDAEFQKRVKRRDHTPDKTQEEIDRQKELKRARYLHKLKNFNSQTSAPLDGVNTTDAVVDVPESGLSKDQVLSMYQHALKKPKHIRKALARRTKRREKQYALDDVSGVWELPGKGDFVLDKPSKDKTHKKYFLTEAESTELKDISDAKERRAAIKKLIQKKKKVKINMESSDSDEDFAPADQALDPEPVAAPKVAEI